MPNKTETHDPQTGEILMPPAQPAGSVPATVERRPAGGQLELPPPQILPKTDFAKLAEAIAECTKEIGENPVIKAGENKFQNYNYARMQDILGTLTPLMAKHGIIVMQTEVQRGFMDGGNAIYATYDFTILHKSGEVWPFPQRQTGVSMTRDSKGGFDDKGLNKCHTSARKYFLMALFQIPTIDDADGEDGYTRSHRPVTKGNGKPAQRSENPAPPEDQTEAPPKEKQTPHTIERPQGISAAAWGGKFIAAILECDDVEEIEKWSQANEEALEALEGHAPRVYQNVKKTIDNRVKWITQQ
jgi:ERF superfamily